MFNVRCEGISVLNAFLLPLSQLGIETKLIKKGKIWEYVKTFSLDILKDTFGSTNLENGLSKKQ